MQALSILFGAGFAGLTAISLGGLLLGGACRNHATRFVTGAAVLSLCVFGICAAGLAYPLVFACFGAGAILAGRRPAMDFFRALRLPKPNSHCILFYLLFVLVAAYFFLYFFNAMAPEHSPDGSAYHLGNVNRFFREHGFRRITDDMYMNFSQGVELLFLFAYAFGRHSAASLVHFMFLLALVWQMVDWGCRSKFAFPALCAGLLVFFSPVVGVDAASAYNDVAVAAAAFTLFYLLELWVAERSPRVLVAIGLIAGFCYAAKYTAWTATPYALGFIAWITWKDRKPGALRSALRNAAVAGAAAALLVAPWMFKNWLWLQNPLSPFFNNIFPNPYVTVEFERSYRNYLALYDLPSRWRIPMAVTTEGGLSGLLGPVFLLAPLALLSLRRREGRRLLLAALVFGAFYFSNIGTRFLIPALPFVALSLALALSAVPAAALALVLIHAVISWPSVLPRYAKFEAWRLIKVPYREALRIKPEAGFLQSKMLYYPVVRLIEEKTPPGARIFTRTGIPAAYTTRNILVGFQSAQNKMRETILWSGMAPEYAPTLRMRFAFPRASLRAVRVVQTGTAEGIWSVNEFRLYDSGRELPRSPAWRLTAHPYPWGIQDAFDNSLVTLWQCGEQIRPGQSISVDFGSSVNVDSAVVEAAPNQWGIKLQLEGQAGNGQWKLLAPQPEISSAGRPLGLRRGAAEELKRRGVDYVLVFEDEVGAGDMRRNADFWGVTEVGEARGARLYKLP